MGSHVCQGAFQRGLVGAGLRDGICAPGPAVLGRCRLLDDVPSIRPSRRHSCLALFCLHSGAHRHPRSRFSPHNHDPSLRLSESRNSLNSAGRGDEFTLDESAIAGPTTVEPTSVIPGDHAKRSRLAYPPAAAAQIVLWSLVSVAGDWQIHPAENQRVRRVFDTSAAQIASRFRRQS